MQQLGAKLELECRLWTPNPSPHSAVLGLMEWHLTFREWKGKNFKRLAKKRELFPNGPELFDAGEAVEMDLG